MKKLFSGIVVALVLLLTLTTPVLASTWRGGNFYTSAYGAKSDIYTPSSAPYLGHYNGESSWVSTAKTAEGYWIQTGWHYNGNDTSNAWSYTEANTSGMYCQYNVATHAWNSSKNYKVLYDSPYWRCYINGSLYLSVSGGGLPTPPTELQAEVEVHESSSTVVCTSFTNVEYMDSSGNWYDFSQDHLFANSPYDISGYTWEYLIWGP